MRFQTNKELILSTAISAVGQRHDDPTYSILKAHLLVEELLRLFLARIVSHASALEGARLGFAQTLAISKSLCPWLQPDDWIWGMASKLNSLRNDLAHNLEPDEMVKRVADYVGLWATRHSLPVSDAVRDPLKQHKDKTGAVFSSLDMVNIAFFSVLAARLGVPVEGLNFPELRVRLVVVEETQQ